MSAGKHRASVELLHKAPTVRHNLPPFPRYCACERCDQRRASQARFRAEFWKTLERATAGVLR